MSIENSIVAGLTKAANFYAQKVAQKIREVNAPHRMAEKVIVGQAVVSGNQASIDISITDDAAPAFEFGSGIHATKGPAEKYIIAPRNKGALAFDWSPEDEGMVFKSPKFIAQIGDDRWLFRFVEHPGVAPRPFMRPTLLENRQEIAKMIGKEFSHQIFVEIREAIREANAK